MQSLGRSLRGRDLWALTITNPHTGPALEKPALYVDAQIHAEEHAPSLAALHLAWHLLTGYGRDGGVTRLLDETAFYILPRVNPDGAEVSLQAPFARWCGNGRRAAGTPDERRRGLYQCDLDGDGTIARMRAPDPAGEWAVSGQDPRVMVQRRPGESGGVYYRLYPEGLVPDFDGVEPEVEPTRDGNLNRQFPGGWEPESRQYGAGPYPGSEPESRAVIEFILAHPNICGVNTLHTHGGLHLRPSGTRSDVEMNPPDLALLEVLGAAGARTTGYKTVSVFEEFTPDKTKVRRGCLDDWTFEELGIPSFTTELWDAETAAGIEKRQHYGNERDEAAQTKLLDWVREQVGEAGWRPWRPFEHPQLGPVEIGGLVDIWVLRNPPPHMLEEICRRHTGFCLEQAAAGPRLELRQVAVKKLGSGSGTNLYRVGATVANTGFLPTNLSETALEKRAVEPVRARLALENAELVMGPAEVEVGHLAGRANLPLSRGEERGRGAGAVQWLVRAGSGPARATITAWSGKAGRRSVELPINEDRPGTSG